MSNRNFGFIYSTSISAFIIIKITYFGLYFEIQMKKRDFSFFQPTISSWGHVRSNPGQSINLAKTNKSFQVLSILKSDNLQKSLGPKESRLEDSNYFSDLSVQRNPVQLFKEETRVSITRLEQFSGFEFFSFFGYFREIKFGIFGSIFWVRIKYHDHDLPESIATPKSPTTFESLKSNSRNWLIEQRRKNWLAD